LRRADERKNEQCRPKESHLIFCAQWFENGINLLLDGFLLIDFMVEEYGMEKLFNILSDKETLFGKKLSKQLKTDLPSFMRRLNAWKRGKAN